MTEVNGSHHMDHEQSIETQAAERYLLGELSPAAREEFEQHFFECAECAEEVRVGFQFRHNLESLFEEESRGMNQFRRTTGGSGVTRGRGWFASVSSAARLPLAACLGIAAFSGYQNAVEIPALHARLATPRVLSPIVLAPASRAQAPSLLIPAGADFLNVALAPGAARSGGEYECRLRSASGQTLWRLPVKAPGPDADFTMLIPTAGLANGNYEAIVAGAGGRDAAEAEHYRFSVRRE